MSSASRSSAHAAGSDATAMEMTDMVAAGIIDPAKVTKVALQNAASIAGLLLTTEAVVGEAQQKTRRTTGTPVPDDDDYD